MKVAYLGTSPFAVAVMERVADRHEVLAVTRPDRPQGRGRKIQSPPVATAGRALGLEVLQPDDVHDQAVVARIDEADAIVVCAFGALIKEPLLSREILNVHPSLLPRWRGAAPIERAIMAGDAQTGVAIMRLTEGLDAGPVALQATEPIRPDDDYGTLAHRLQDLGAELLLEALEGDLRWGEQTEDGVTYAEKITAADRTLDPAAPPEARERAVRALRPHIGARIELPDGAFLGVWDARVGEGEVTWRGLELLEVQPAGGRRMPAGAWLRGSQSSLEP